MIGASVRRYEKMCEGEDNGGRPVHRSREWKAKERNCEKNGAGYRISCLSCRSEVAYEGETGSNGYSRGKEHEAALEHKQEENANWKHCLVAHEGQRVEFSMKVVGNFH